jgi:L-2-hydroxyglutarate oxidase LhgO
LALRGHEVIVAEKADGIGSGVSSRNSEVIHGGMYYPSGSLRARHCVAGRRMLYAFSESHGVPHRKCGKLIVATNSLEQAKIEGIHAQGITNGVEGLRLLSGDKARALEPELACTGAVLSSETGIVDSHAFMLALQGNLEAAGGMIALHAPVERIARAGAVWTAAVGGPDAMELGVEAVVNAGGARGSRHRAGDGGLSARAGAAPRARQGQLLRLHRPARLPPPDLPRPRGRRARHPRDARSRWAHALRAGRGMD